MIVAHLADLHLGYRAYHRLGAGGINAREKDVADAFDAAVRKLCELKADLIVIAGDVFHTVRPSNASIAIAFRQFARLRRALPRTPVVIIAGNHDSPRSLETGSILALLAEIEDVHVVDREVRCVELKKLDTAVLCLPHNALASGGIGALEPRRGYGTNVLTMHATVRGPEVDELLGYAGEFGGAQIDIADIRVERWDYVALGHYHIATPLAPNMWYAGALERTATNIWIETEPKGFVVYDTDAARATFHKLPTRPMLDLPRITARADADAFLAPDELDARIRRTVDGVNGGIDSKIVRLILDDVPRELFRELDHRRLREYRARALHFHLDVRRPERRLRAPVAAARRVSLEDEAEAFLVRDWQPSGRDIQKTRLVALARQYLAEAAREGMDPLLVAAEPGL